MQVSTYRLAKLMDRVREIAERPSNREKADMWRPLDPKGWEPAFIRTLPKRSPGGKIPFVVEPGLGLWSKLLGFSLHDYYHDPLTYAVAQLEMKVFHADHFDDDTVIDKGFRLMISTTLEGSLMGVPYELSEEGHPRLDYRRPPILSMEDIASFRPPDFHASGTMPALHGFYSTLRELLDEDFLVKFPDWIMGPFGVAAAMRGFENLLMDMVADREFAVRLLNLVIEARKGWQRELDGFLGIRRSRGLLGNDDVSCPTLSPAMYRESLLPLEKGLCEYYGGIFYWHSCGNTTGLLEHIAEIPRIDLFHCGPWTDVARACRCFEGRETALEIMVEPIDKVQLARGAERTAFLREIAGQIPPDTNCYIKADSLEVLRNPGQELEAVTAWISAAREVLG
jgi:hypothetical protein